ncbi:MAG: hypothetical protein AAF436_17120 [Myxococcota bacterium]
MANTSNKTWLWVLVLVGVAGYLGWRTYSTLASESVSENDADEPLVASAAVEDSRAQPEPVPDYWDTPEETPLWTGRPDAIVNQVHAALKSWPLDKPLPREVWPLTTTAAQLRQGPVEAYPLEAAMLATAAIRRGGTRANIAEVWEYPTEGSPADPLGRIGYYAVAVFDSDDLEAARLLDPWGGRADAAGASYRVLTDDAVNAAAMGLSVYQASEDPVAEQPATTDLKPALAADPESPVLAAQHAALLLAEREIDAAIAAMDEAYALRADPARRLLLANADLLRALKERVRNRETGAEEAEALFDRALSTASSVTQSHPRYWRAYEVLANIHMTGLELDEAEAALARADEVAGDAAGTASTWTSLYLRRREPQRAVERFLRAVEERPDDWRLRIELAGLLQRAGQPSDPAWLEAIARAPADKKEGVRELATNALGREPRQP